MSQHVVKDDTDNFRSTAAQVLSTVALGFLGANVGLIQAMPTFVIGALRDDGSALDLSENEASWFASLLYALLPFGSLGSSFLQDFLGRRLCLILVNFPMLAGWLILYFANAKFHLFVAVLLMGLSVGFMEAPILSYIGETTQPRLRGILGSSSTVFYNFGLLVESFLGAVLPWRTMVLWSVIGPLAGFFGMCLVPESPAWLASKGRVREAEKSFQWLRGWVKPQAVRGELWTLVNYVKKTQNVNINEDSEDYNPVAMIEVSRQLTSSPPAHIFNVQEEPVDFDTKKSWRALLEPGVLASFRLISIHFIVSCFTSMMAMRPFFIEILGNLKLPLKPHYVVAICGGLQLLGAVSMALILRPLGKRRLTFLSLTLSVLCCLALGTYILIDLHFPWVPVIFFALSFYSGTLGIMVVPWFLTMELFPLRVRGLAEGICGAIGYSVMFLVTLTYYKLADVLGVFGVCFFYGTVGILGFIYLYLEMPETEGVSLEIIEKRLNEQRTNRNMDIHV